jgi:hypothetical protein
MIGSAVPWRPCTVGIDTSKAGFELSILTIDSDSKTIDLCRSILNSMEVRHVPIQV